MRILVVEDELRVAAALKRGLEAESYAVDVAADGHEGLWHASERAYDAIVLDIMLPKMDGYELCRTLRSNSNWSPILMLTAKDGEYDEARALDAGADDYLTKPFSYVVLVARLRALFRRSGRLKAVIYEAGDLRLDPVGHVVQRADIDVRLTAREFSVLEFLMRHANEVVSKRELLDAVWDFDFEGDPNIVEVYIRNLRRKIDDPFNRRTIETLRGAGYRLAGDGGRDAG